MTSLFYIGVIIFCLILGGVHLSSKYVDGPVTSAVVIFVIVYLSGVLTAIGLLAQ